MIKKKNIQQKSKITKAKRVKNHCLATKTRFTNYAKNNLPKTKKRLVFDIILLVVFAIWLAIIVNDILRHHAVATAINNLGSQLRTHKEFERYYFGRMCGGGQGKGVAVYSCDMRGLKYYRGATLKQANHMKDILQSTVKNSDDFTIISEKRTKDYFGYGTIFTLNKHDNRCGASIYYDGYLTDKNELRVSVSCDDTWWHEKVYGLFKQGV